MGIEQFGSGVGGFGGMGGSMNATIRSSLEQVISLPHSKSRQIVTCVDRT